jgi:hypothetical protein
VRQSKTGHEVHIRAPGPLWEELNKAKREGTQIVVNNIGQPYTRDGLQSNLWRLVKNLETKRWSSRGFASMAFGTPLVIATPWFARPEGSIAAGDQVVHRIGVAGIGV